MVPSEEASVASEENFEELSALLDQAQGLVNSLEETVPLNYKREITHLAQDLEVLETWTDNAGQEDVEALAGATIVVETAQERVDYLQDQLSEDDPGTRNRLEEIEDTLEDIEDITDPLEIKTSAYVTYVNRQFAKRYFEPSVTVGDILRAFGREDVEELGLYPLTGLFGEAIPDLAFPANKEVNLDKENRIYWETESDGGSIAIDELYQELSDSTQKAIDKLRDRRPEAKVIAIEGDWAFVSIGEIDVARVADVFEQDHAIGILRIPTKFPDGERPYGLITVPSLDRRDGKDIDSQHRNHEKSRPVEKALPNDDIGFWSWRWEKVSRSDPAHLSKGPDLFRERLRKEL